MSIFSIPLYIPDVEVINVEQDRHSFIITVKNTVNQTECQKCGNVITQRRGEDKPLFDQLVYLKLHLVRYPLHILAVSKNRKKATIKAFCQIFPFRLTVISAQQKKCLILA